MLIELLQNEDELTEAERELARYILAHVDTVKEMTVRGLAEKAFVSPPTVSRLCQKAGMKSWGDFKVHLATEFTENYREMMQVDSNFPFGVGDSPREIVDKIAQLNVRHTLTAKDNIDFATMEKAVDAIAGRREIDIYGRGVSLSAAEEFAEKMLRIGHPTTILKGDTRQYYQAVTSTADQFAMIISHSGQSEHLKRVAKLLRDRDVPLLLITGSRLSPMVRYATFVSYIHSEEELGMQQKMERFGVQTVIHFILDVLYALTFSRNYSQNIAAVRQQGEQQI